MDTTAPIPNNVLSDMLANDFLRFLDAVPKHIGHKVNGIRRRLDQLGIDAGKSFKVWPGNCDRAYEVLKELYRPHLRTVFKTVDDYLTALDNLDIPLREKVITTHQLMTVGTNDYGLTPRDDAQAYQTFKDLYRMNLTAQPIRSSDDFEKMFMG